MVATIQIVALFLVASATVVANDQCRHFAPHYVVSATHNAPGPWEAALSVERHAPSPKLHFGVRPASSSQVEKLSVTLSGQIPLGMMEAADDGYEDVAGIGWYNVHAERVTWAEAKATCEAERAHLVLIDTPEEAAAVSTLLARNRSALSYDLHAGFLAKDYANSFVTVQGEPLSATGYSGWGPGQPDMSICGRVDPHGMLRDGMCDWVEPASFVCERGGSPSTGNPPPAPTVANPSRAAPGTPPDGYGPVNPHGGNSLYKLHVTPDTWWKAEARCGAEGAHLAVLNSDAEANVVVEMVRRAADMQLVVLPYVYLGVLAELNFVTVFGQPLSEVHKTLWASGYPAFKNCVVANHNGTLWVTQCWAMYPFLCEYEAS